MGGPRTVLVLQGPNLNLLGTREPEVYGAGSLSDLTDRLDAVAAAHGVALRHVQHNGEGALVGAIHAAAADGLVGAIVNAAAYTHTSIALRDALLATQLPFVEVHLSNVWKREPFRHTSLLSDVAIGVISGLGPIGYELGLVALLDHLGAPPPAS